MDRISAKDIVNRIYHNVTIGAGSGGYPTIGIKNEVASEAGR